MANHIARPGYEPGDPEHFYLPDYLAWEAARRMGVPITRVLSPDYAGSVHALSNMAEIRDLSYSLGGRSVMPKREIVLIGPDGHSPIVIPGLGVTEAAELEDIATEVYESQEKKLRAGKEIVDFDQLREEEGLPTREEFDPLFRQALRDRIAKHKANPRTDPAREPQKARGLVAVAKPSSTPEEDEIVECS